MLRLGSMVADQIARAVEALERHDADLALEVITGDGRLNEAQRLITRPGRTHHRDAATGCP